MRIVEEDEPGSKLSGLWKASAAIGAARCWITLSPFYVPIACMTPGTTKIKSGAYPLKMIGIPKRSSSHDYRPYHPIREYCRGARHLSLPHDCATRPAVGR